MNPNETPEEIAENDNNIDNAYEEETENTADAAISPEFDESEADSESVLAAQDEKPHRNRSLVVAACVFAATLLAFAVWYAFFNSDITGVWATDVQFEHEDGSTTTEAMKFSFSDSDTRMTFFENEKSYFSDKESRTARAEMINCGMTFPGGYMTQEDTSGEDSIYVYLSVGGNPISYNYKLTGNMFTGRQLVLYSPAQFDEDGEVVQEAQEMVFTESEKTYTLDPAQDFKPNSGVVGSWECEGLGFTFSSDGRFAEDLDYCYIDGIYSFGEVNGYDAIICEYKYNGEIHTVGYPYLLKGDVMTLTIDGYDYDLQKVSE